MCQCEDRPCCGHLAEERADAQYWEERSFFADDFYDDNDWEDEDEDWDYEYAGPAEDIALESSLFGDC